MATPIPCDWEGCTELADILLSDIANGEGSGWCGPHYLEVCRQVVQASDDAAAQAEAAEADAAAVARLDALGRESDPTGSGPSSDAGSLPVADGGTPGELLHDAVSILGAEPGDELAAEAADTEVEPVAG